MSGVRIYDLAKELHLSNNDIIEMSKAFGEDGKAPSSTIKDETAEAIRHQLSANGNGSANGTSLAAPSGNGSAPIPVANGITPPAAVSASPAELPKTVDIPDVVALKDFAVMIGVPAPDIQKKLMGLGVLASLNQKLSPEVTTRLAKSYKVSINIVPLGAPKPASIPAADDTWAACRRRSHADRA